MAGIQKSSPWQAQPAGGLWLAFKKAARGKRSQPAVATFEYDLEENLLRLREALCAGEYCPGVP
ncbi:MAG: hypothetical protein MUC85_10360 [Anaerolineales bacterium]|nr:hypothetical protein [Anaerolineales bacterium]